jgi:hypothetical protein
VGGGTKGEGEERRGECLNYFICMCENRIVKPVKIVESGERS